MRPSSVGPSRSLARLVLLCAAFTAAVVAIPTGGALLSGSPGAATGDPDTDLAAAFDGPDRRLVERGRGAEAVGLPSPLLDLPSVGGGQLPLTGSGRPVILLLTSPGCDACTAELAKLAALSVVYFDDVYVAAVTPPGGEEDLLAMLADAGGEGLVLAGVDEGGSLVSGLGITSAPSTAVVGPQGVVDAVWTEPVPLNVFYAFLQKAYGLKRG